MVSCFFSLKSVVVCSLGFFLAFVFWLFSLSFLGFGSLFFFSLGNIYSLLVFYFDCEYGCENWFC